MILEDDKQTLLYLSMTIPKNMQYLIKIQSVTSGMTADKYRNMLLRDERRKKTSEMDTMRTYAAARPPGKRTPSPTTHMILMSLLVIKPSVRVRMMLRRSMMVCKIQVGDET